MTSKLDAIDKLLAEEPYAGPPREDEFTIQDFIQRFKEKNNQSLSHPGASKRLDKMIEAGMVTMRKGRVSTKQGNIYRIIQ